MTGGQPFSHKAYNECETFRYHGSMQRQHIASRHLALERRIMIAPDDHPLKADTDNPRRAPAPVNAVSNEAPGTWVLIRGLLREQGHWGSFAQALAQAHPDSRVLTLDIAGNGQYCAQASHLSIGKVVDSLRQTLDMASCVGPVRLLGISMGGMIAVDWAQRYPQELAGAVLINTSLGRFSPFYHRLRAGNYGRILRCLFSDKLSREAQILALSSNNPEARGQALQDWVDIARQRPVQRRNLLRQLYAAGAYRPRDEAPEVPMLLLASAQDRIVDVRCSQALADAWQLELQVHSQAGHDLPLDAPEWVITRIMHWCSG